ncbi:MAG: carotenoid biosynthesis protein [Chloroflexota bacterium]|nr:carotenoid biosynthesis protein [Chloroflexota bacterium]
MKILPKMDRITYATIPMKTRIVAALAVLWLLAMIGVPILRWTRGDAAVVDWLPITVLLQVGAVMMALSGSFGVRKMQIILVLVPLIAWVAEFVGHNTGLPFGAYYYTDRLQPQLGGVPLLVPLAWLMMLPPAWAVAGLLLMRADGTLRGGRLGFAAVTALVFTAWDLFLDPQMVAWDLWRWESPGAFNYFGIPWANYAGWLFVSFTMTLIASLVIKIDGTTTYPFFILLIIYGITWALQTMGLMVFWGLPGPALVGGAVMGLCLAAAVRAYRRRRDGLGDQLR